MVANPTNEAAFTDAQSTNSSSRNARKIADLDLFFQKKASTKDINKVTNVQAVKRSVRNLVLLNHYEKPFHPEIGSGVREMLFENMTPLTSIILSKKVQDVIENYEPRARVENVQAFPRIDNNAYHLNIIFTILNAPTELIELGIVLETLR